MTKQAALGLEVASVLHYSITQRFVSHTGCLSTLGNYSKCANMEVWGRIVQQEAVKVNLSGFQRLRTEPGGNITITRTASVPEVLNATVLCLLFSSLLFLPLAPVIYRHNKSAPLTLLLSWWTLRGMTPAWAFHPLAPTASPHPTHRLAQKHQSVNKNSVQTTDL